MQTRQPTTFSAHASLPHVPLSPDELEDEFAPDLLAPGVHESPERFLMLEILAGAVREFQRTGPLSVQASVWLHDLSGTVGTVPAAYIFHVLGRDHGAFLAKLDAGFRIRVTHVRSGQGRRCVQQRTVRKKWRAA